MDIYQLEYVLAVAKYRNFTRASEELNISQSSLSQQIAKLEDELGVRLFERTTRSVYPSPAGIDFIKHATKIMDECNLAKQTVKKYISAELGKIIIGYIPIIGVYGIPSLITSFQERYLKIKVEFLEAQWNIVSKSNL